MSDERLSPNKLAHVVWRTADLENMVAWYVELLGAEIVFSNEAIAFITYDDEHHRMAFVATPDHEPVQSENSNLEHVAFTFDEFDDLLTKYGQLAAAGVEPYWTINHGPTTSIYYRDPDGNQIELQYDNYPNPEDLADWFRTGAFMRNPIGVEFDPDELIDARADGVPVGRLVHRADTPTNFVEAHSGG